LSNLLAGAIKEGLHTALDTTGYAPWDQIEKLLPFVDLILWDIKHLNSLKHKRTTGVDNALILENLLKVSRAKPVWLRVPLIAHFNDSEEHVRDIIRLAQRLDVEKISLLPYHEGGKSKCMQMGLVYRFDEGIAPDEEQTIHFKELIEEEGLKAAIGN
jgi:pyruvate formate lyase activating enzyme